MAMKIDDARVKLATATVTVSLLVVLGLLVRGLWAK
jgi:hypothetical protein